MRTFSVNSGLQTGTYSLDIDSDGVADIKFVQTYSIPASPELKVIALDSAIGFRGDVLDDSVFTQTIRFTQGDSLNGYRTDQIYNSTCSNPGNFVFQGATARFFVKALLANAALSVTDSFKTGMFTLRDQSYHNGPTYGGVGHDTTYYYSNNLSYTCHDFPSGVITYLAFKQTKNGISRMGWIALKLASGSGYYIESYGFQDR